MALVAFLKEFPKEFLQFVFPPICGVCAERLRAGEDIVCDYCRDALDLVQPPFCMRCGNTMKYSRKAAPDDLCDFCRKEERYFDLARATCEYDDLAGEMVHQLKSAHREELARPMAAMMVHAWMKWLNERRYDAIVPVPLHRTRRRQRGFNQAELIARHLSGFIGIPAEPFMLKQIRPTMEQKKLARHERWGNVRGAFALEKSHEANGLEILLVDDVSTTCSTGNACAEVLMEAGASAVSLLTFARA